MIMQNKTFDQIFEIMEASFPLAEFRNYEEQKKLLSNPRYHIFTEKNEQGEVIAFLCEWKFKTFRYVENIAVAPAKRGSGVGRRLMEYYINQSTLPIVLEVEPPSDDLKRRRIQFYERLGFHLNDYEYTQPPLRENTPPLSLCLMTYPEPLTPSEYEAVKKQLYREVYNLCS